MSHAYNATGGNHDAPSTRDRSTPPADILTVPKPTPDEDGVWSVGSYEVSAQPAAGGPVVDLVTDWGGRDELPPDQAEALGAALIAAAQEARRIAAEAAQEET